ncbi:hypothetical protein GCM10010129_70830 [Streptomyces fumigatiscleroticus]|nr:hypothetical protein GCM10010129_70830 [Streptomyces fumigatiscleroticus]
MRQELLNAVRRLGPVLLLAVAATVMWAAWLGWDQHYDEQPDGTTTGPYEAWQVIGLVLTLLAAVYWAASRRHRAGAVLGPTIGLTVAACYDWSDDATGLFAVGVAMIMVGTLAATAVVSTAITYAQRDGRRIGA